MRGNGTVTPRSRIRYAETVALAEEVESYRSLYNEVRPHETLGQVPPLSVYLSEPNLFQRESVQKT
jgi:transposase InsO family protein